MMLDHTRPFQIKSNASKYTPGAVLTQMNPNRDRNPVAFMSKTFTDTEKQYEVYDRKLPLKNGITTFKDLDTQLWSTLITRT